MNEINKQLVETIRRLEVKLNTQQKEYQEQLSGLQMQLETMQEQLSLLANFVESSLQNVENVIEQEILK